MGASELPPCCRGCELYETEARHCLLLAHPTEENRRQLLTMPCNVQELLARRFRSHGPDIAREALVSWLEPDWDEEALRASYGRAPIDARLWLTSWPYLYLGRNAVRRQWRRNREQPYSEPPTDPQTADPTLRGRVLFALERLRIVDQVGYGMMIELMRGDFKPALWKHELSCSDATVTDRKYLAVWRYCVVFFEVLDELDPPSRFAVEARRFAAGDPDDATALSNVRATMRSPSLSLADFRALYRSGAAATLELLARSDALGEQSMDRFDGAFRRVLRIEGTSRAEGSPR
jgi:hypothetical protein